MEDSTFRAYRTNPKFLSTILPLSRELNAILGRIFECDPCKRISIPELRSLIFNCPRLTTRSSGALPPTPPSEPQYVPEAPLNMLPDCLQTFDQCSVVPNASIFPAPGHQITTQLSGSSTGSLVSDNGSTFSEASSCSSLSANENFDNGPQKQPIIQAMGYAPLQFQSAAQCLQNYCQVDPVPGMIHPQPFLNSVQVC